MQYLDFFKLQSKNLLSDSQTDMPKYFPNAKFWISKYIKNADDFTLMKAQHVVANIAGFNKWDDLAHASDAQLEVAKNLFDNRDNILARLDEIFGHKVPDYKIIDLDPEYSQGGVSNWNKDGYTVSGVNKIQGIFNLVQAQTLKEIYSVLGKSYAEYDSTSIWGLSIMSARVIAESEGAVNHGDWKTSSLLYNQLNIPYLTLIKSLWKNRKSFRDYITQSLDFFKKHPLAIKMENIHWDSEGQICNEV